MDRDQYLWEGVHVMGSLSWSFGSVGMYPAYGHGPAGNVPIDLSPGYQYLSTVCTRLYPSPASNSYARSDQSTLYGSSPMVVYMLIRYHSRPEVIIWPFYISEHYSDPPIGVGSNTPLQACACVCTCKVSWLSVGFLQRLASCIHGTPLKNPCGEKRYVAHESWAALWPLWACPMSLGPSMGALISP